VRATKKIERQKNAHPRYFEDLKRRELGAAVSRNQNRRKDRKMGDRKRFLPGEQRMDESFHRSPFLKRG
jgi:hypothetical protein